ncbi:calcium-binding protein [Brevundimonas sp. BR2-1]|uniref:calcium-binding protein n=1 Tax=unclassified Brevundimonas TaxID=2622653 RepID=UPI002FCBC573
MKTLLLLPAALAAFAAGPALAQQGSGAMFAEADVNNDGRLSRLEFDAVRENLFARIDANDDDRLTLQELRSLRSDDAPRTRQRPNRDQISKLRAIDRNRNRAVDIGEFRALGDQRFAALDRNRDGFIMRDEMADLAEAAGLGR